MAEPMTTELPDLFRFEDGRRVQTAKDWHDRRHELAGAIIEIEYGGLPPKPSGMQAEHLHSYNVERFMGAAYTKYRLLSKDDRSFHFRLDLLVPPGKGPFPTVLTGDGCYRFITDELTVDILKRGFILAQFQRTDIVPDVYNSYRFAAARSFTDSYARTTGTGQESPRPVER